MSNSTVQKLHELLEDFGVGMLVTRTEGDGMRGRPMALAQTEPDGTLWFFTNRNSGKIDEIEKDSHVAVTMQSNTKFVSLSGRASPIADRDKIASLWRTEWKVWFPGGKEDAGIILLRIEVAFGEYWDNSGISGIKYLIEAGKALMTGSRPDVEQDDKVHAKVALQP